MKKTATDLSRMQWQWDDERYDNDALKIGCLQRIADACELMARNHAELVRERDSLKRQVEELADEILRLERSTAALRGCLRKAKG